MENILPFKYKNISLEHKKFINIMSSEVINTLYHISQLYL